MNRGTGAAAPLRILHILRQPTGGLFRHVVDLARGQTARGHAVGLVADSNTGRSKPSADLLADLDATLALGVTRVPMSRQVGLLDRGAIARVTQRAAEVHADVLHGHGAKGGAYARLAGGTAIRAYTPHGGSLFFSPYTPMGFVYYAAERWLRRRTDLILFESGWAEARFRRHVGAPPPLSRVVHNGIGPGDLAPVEPDGDAADIVFIGGLRLRKGIDVLLEALAALRAEGWDGRAILYGEGPDRRACEERARALGLAAQASFPGETEARAGFRSGRLLVIPSRQESLPYIVLEAAGARMPMVTTGAGGIPEIFGPDAGALVPVGDRDGLVAAIRRMRAGGSPGLVERLHERVARFFSVDAMTDAVLAAYAEAHSRRR